MDNVFAQAAKNLPGHWYKGEYTDGQGNFCALGHIAAARGIKASDFYCDEDSYFLEGEVDLLDSLTKEMTNSYHYFIADYNDDEATTEEEIVTLLEKAAVRWDERI